MHCACAINGHCVFKSIQFSVQRKRWCIGVEAYITEGSVFNLYPLHVYLPWDDEEEEANAMLRA